MEVVKSKKYVAHIVALPYPSQGHINPMLQFCKRLVSKGLKTTLAITNFISHSMCPSSDTVGIDTISDGFDKGGYAEAKSNEAYIEGFEKAGSKTLADLVKRYEKTEFPITCIIYDAFMPWALDVAQGHSLIGACFLTQASAVNHIYYYVHHKNMLLPVSSPTVKIPGLPELEPRDMPSFIYAYGTYPAYFEMVLNQYINLEKADYVFVNSFYKLEVEATDIMSKVTQLSTIGPTLPSFYLDNRVENDIEYGLNLFQVDASTCINWLNTKPEGSVVYVAFGSMSTFCEKQMEEIAWGLKAINSYFLWVVRTCDEQKIPKRFIYETTDKGLVVNWSPQLQILSNKAIGCFFSHGGWNSTLEALSLGVPMVVMPLWSDQTTNAKLIQDVWSVGVRVEVTEEGIVGRKEIEKCVTSVLQGEKGKEMKKNSLRWKELAKEAVSESGTSDKNIEEFVSRCTRFSLIQTSSYINAGGLHTIDSCGSTLPRTPHITET